MYLIGQVRVNPPLISLSSAPPLLDPDPLDSSYSTFSDVCNGFYTNESVRIRPEDRPIHSTRQAPPIEAPASGGQEFLMERGRRKTKEMVVLAIVYTVHRTQHTATQHTARISLFFFSSSKDTFIEIPFHRFDSFLNQYTIDIILRKPRLPLLRQVD